MGRPPKDHSESEISTAAETPVADILPAGPLTTDVLLTLIATMQKQLAESQKMQAEANKALAEAIIEAGKPKEALLTKRQIAEQANADAESRKQKELLLRQKVNQQWAQKNCPHLAGGLGETHDIYGRSAFIWHTLDVGALVGICLECGQQVFQDDPDFVKFRNMKPFNKNESAGGKRYTHGNIPQDYRLKDS
jgi:hypothetical protein